MVQPARRETQLVKKILWSSNSSVNVCPLGNVTGRYGMIRTTNMIKVNTTILMCVYIHTIYIIYLYREEEKRLLSTLSSNLLWNIYN